MTITRLDARIADIRTLSASAREVELALSAPLSFLPGAFVNVFVEKEGKRERRAYTIAGTNAARDRIALAIRDGRPEGVSHLFFRPTAHMLPISIMGPLGVNTIDKITRDRVFLFAFGIGVSAVRGLAEALLARPTLKELWIITGSRTEDEILYKEYFESLAKRDARVTTRFVVSRPRQTDYPMKGYLQDHVDDMDFTSASAYVCGHGAACETLRARIAALAPHTEFLIESFDS